MQLPKISTKIFFLSVIAIVLSNIIGVVLAELISSGFIFKEQLQYTMLVKQHAMLINGFPFIFAIIAIRLYFVRMHKKLADVTAYRKKILNLPLVVALITFSAWIISFVMNYFVVLYYGLPFNGSFLILKIIRTGSIGFISFVISYSLQDFVNQKYLIPKFFDNRMEKYKEMYQPSINKKFYIYFLAVHLAPMMFATWVFFWIGTQTNAMNHTQFIYIIAYGVFAMFFGVLLTMLLAQKFHTPLIKAKKAAQSIKTGHYDIKLDVTSTDEIGILSENINSMAEKLHDNQDKIIALTQEIEDTQKEVVFTMGAIGESRSKETGNHVRRVSEYSKILALQYGFSNEQAELLKQASPMHDIGKVAIADNILNKPGKLTQEEFVVMKTHAALGYEMLKHSDQELLKAAAIVAYEHHEKWDGTGYPNGKKGEDIHIFGRITAIADVFDALGSDRVYKKAWDDEKIFAFFNERKGKHFDPALIELFFENIASILEIRNTFKDTYDDTSSTKNSIKEIAVDMVSTYQKKLMQIFS